MNYYHMQLHPADLQNYSVQNILEIIEKGFIGIDVNKDDAKKINCHNKPFDQWTEEELDKYSQDEHTKWKSLIKSFLSLKKGDYVVVRHGNQFVALTEITGNYIFKDDNLVWFRHRYPVKILFTYKDTKKKYVFTKYQGTFEVSKSGETYKIISEIVNDYKYQQIINKYIDFCNSGEDWDEGYKWETVSHFQKHWNVDASDFGAMFKEAVKKRENLVHQYSIGTLIDSANLFPETVKNILKYIFNEGYPVNQRYEYFKTETGKLAKKIKEVKNLDKLPAQPRETVFAFLLTCRYPHTHYFYNYSYYEKFTKFVGQKSKKYGENYSHYFELMNFFRDNYVKKTPEVINLTVQKLPENEPDKENLSLITQSVIYIAFKDEKDLLSALKEIGYENAKNLYILIDKLISELNIEKDDERIHYYSSPKNNLNITIGQRYAIRLDTKKLYWDILIPKETNIEEDKTGFEFEGNSEPVTFRTYDFDEIKFYEKDFFKASKFELDRTKKSGYRGYTNVAFENSVFDFNYRNKLFNRVFGQPFNNENAMSKKMNIPLNQILFGPPGTGKTYNTIDRAVEIADNEFYKLNKHNRGALKKRFKKLNESRQIVFTTFHQSMSYEEFVEGLKPYEENKQVYYKIEDGIFKTICKNAENYPGNNYVLIIDEINRGNIAGIFGELITLIEPDKRKGNDEELFVTLPYSQKTFSVPPNLYIIGTMNTADRSVEALDSALRRRFVFAEMPPDEKLLKDDFYGINLQKVLSKINLRIEKLIDKDHKIGHSYFMNLTSVTDLQNVFLNKIIPLLEEYFYGDFAKIGLILGADFIVVNDSEENIFKNIDELEDYSDFENRIIYKTAVPENIDDFITAVKKIYQ